MTVQYQGVWSLQSAAQLQSTQRWVTDPLFENTTLLLQADDAANGAQNNTFLDSSSNSFAITRNGNTTQGSFTPFSLAAGQWSNFFGGSGNMVGNTSAALIGSSTSTFTAEFWVYMTAAPTNTATYAVGLTLDGQANNTVVYSNFGVNTAQKVMLSWYDGSQKTCTGGTVLNLNTWYHIAAVVSSNSISLYVNGILESLTGTTTLTNRSGTASNFAVGSSWYTYFNGYISNVRVCTSVVYTGAFTPSTTPLTTTSQGATNCIFLSSQDNRFKDNSSNNYSLATTGTPSVQAFSPFAPQFQWTPSVIGGSGYFDGTGDYLDFTGSLAISGQFSVECWFYRTTSDNNQRTLFAFNSTNTSYASIRLDTDNANVSGRVVLNMSTSGSSWAATPTVNSAYFKYGWNHIVCTRDSSNGVRIIINGVLQSSSTLSGALYSTSTTHAIGCNNLPGAAANLFFGYVAGLRLVNGSIPTDYQTSSTTVGAIIFTPPTAPVTASSQGATSSNVSLLTNFTNAGIYDGTMKNNLETVGNAQISTAVVKYGSGSMYFDGTGDLLFSPASQNYSFPGDFTIECWVNTSTISTEGGSYRRIFATGPDATTSLQLVFSDNVTTSSNVSVVTNSFVIIGTISVATGAWVHVALTRLGSAMRLFVNGVQSGSTLTTTQAFTGGASNGLFIGSASGGTGRYLGYIDDFRITQGIARYTQNFIPPSVALPRQ